MSVVENLHAESTLDIGYRDLQYLYFEYQEVNDERTLGPANEGLWLQITVWKIGHGHV